MIPMKDLPCWEIMQCGKKQVCAAAKNSKMACWEIASELDSYQSSLNVCKDCIVYVSKQEDNVLSELEIMSILEQKSANGFAAKCPAYMISEGSGEK